MHPPSKSQLKRLEAQIPASPDGHVHVIPQFEGEPKHEDTAKCWCEPTIEADYTDAGGKRLYVHKRPN